MQLALEFLLIGAFLVAYKFFGGIYVATAVAMVGMPVVLAILWLRTKKLPKIFAVSTLLVLALGATTLLLRNPRFIQWKPTVLFWLVALAFLASAFIGERPLAQRFLQQAVGEDRMTRGEWLKLNAAWAAFWLFTGALNLIVALNASENAWVNFKLFGVMGLSIAFMAGQFAWLYARGKLRDDPK
jgi:intracellular septation protein